MLFKIFRVYLVNNSKTMAKAVAKVFDKKARVLPSEIKREADILASLSHPGVIEFKELAEQIKLSYSSGKYRYETALLTEYAPEGDFHDFLEEFGPFPEDLARLYFKQMIQIVEFIHSNNIAHRDLKPENFVLTKEFALKLCDFGSASLSKDDGKFEGFIGTDAYLAPEFHLKKHFDGKKLDIFACGVILFVILVGFRPFTVAKSDDVYYSPLIRNSPQDFWKLHEQNSDSPKQISLSKEAKDLICKMLASDPEKRLTPSEILAHEWFKGETVKQSEIKQRLHEINIEKFQSLSC